MIFIDCSSGSAFIFMCLCSTVQMFMSVSNWRFLMRFYCFVGKISRMLETQVLMRKQKKKQNKNCFVYLIVIEHVRMENICTVNRDLVDRCSATAVFGHHWTKHVDCRTQIDMSEKKFTRFSHSLAFFASSGG